VILVDLSTEQGERLALQQHGLLVHVGEQLQGATLHALRDKIKTGLQQKIKINNVSLIRILHTNPEGTFFLMDAEFVGNVLEVISLCHLSL